MNNSARAGEEEWEREGREERNILRITISLGLRLLKYKRITWSIQLHLVLGTSFPALPHIWSQPYVWEHVSSTRKKSCWIFWSQSVSLQKSTRYFETEACLLETPFPFPFQTTFTFFLTFVISTRVNLILAMKLTLLYLLSCCLLNSFLHKHNSHYCSNYGLFILSIKTM